MISEQHHLFDNQFTVGNSECCKISYPSNSLKLSSSMTNNKTQCLCVSTFRVKKDMITGRRRSGKGNVFSHVCLSTVGQGSMYKVMSLAPTYRVQSLMYRAMAAAPSVQGLTPRHVQSCSSWTSLSSVPPQTCSNLFTVKLILSASRWLVFD